MKKAKKPNVENSSFKLVPGYDDTLEVVNEWDWIVEHLAVDTPTPFSAIKSRIEMEYSGRGVAFEVPSLETIERGLRELVEAGVVEVN